MLPQRLLDTSTETAPPGATYSNVLRRQELRFGRPGHALPPRWRPAFFHPHHRLLAERIEVQLQRRPSLQDVRDALERMDRS
jgi:hypothetical protein